MAEITKKSVLLECLEYERGLMRLCSVDHEGRLPAKGEEDLFYDQQKKCKILEELIQALDSEPVRRSLADWQIELMKMAIPEQITFDKDKYVVRFRENE